MKIAAIRLLAASMIITSIAVAGFLVWCMYLIATWWAICVMCGMTVGLTIWAMIMSWAVGAGWSKKRWSEKDTIFTSEDGPTK